MHSMKVVKAMPVTIDSRLLDCQSTPEIMENLNRILAIVDAVEARVAALEPTEET